MSRVYRIQAVAAVTLYVKAENRAAARRIAQAQKGEAAYADGTLAGVPFSDERYDSPNLPEVSLSPAITITHVAQSASIAAEW